MNILKNPKTWIVRALIIAKLGLLVAVIVSLDSGFQLGDKPVTAAEPQKGDGQSSSKPDDTDNSQTEPEQPADGTKRKSFLSGLLNLPELDPETIKKDELGRYLELAERKKRQVDDRLDLLKKRETQLQRLESSIEDKLRRLDEERRFLAQTLQREKDLKGKRLDKLIKLYEKMEPKSAAPVMEKMDRDLVVALFKNIRQKQITKILEEMDPQKSVELSEYFGRVRSGREYELLREMNKSLEKEFDDCKGMPDS